MKKYILYLVAALVVLFCAGTIALLSKDQPAQASPQVVKLQKQLSDTQAQARIHQDANTTAIKNAGDQIILLTNQKTQLCAQLKTARLTNSICQ